MKCLVHWVMVWNCFREVSGGGFSMKWKNLPLMFCQDIKQNKVKLLQPRLWPLPLLCSRFTIFIFQYSDNIRRLWTHCSGCPLSCWESEIQPKHEILGFYFCCNSNSPNLLGLLPQSTFSKFLLVKSMPSACYLLISAQSAALSWLIDQLAHVI